MTAPDSIHQLVQRFDEHRSSYRSGVYNEAQARLEFIDPLFEALGWDMFNKQGYAEAYKEVIHEDTIKVVEATKAPDYAFRVGGARKFFVEAKKPSINVKDDISPAYQLRRYAWSAKLPLSILTDFEEFAVYDCRARPNMNDKASTARVKFLMYTDYEEKWDEIAAIFSRDAVLKGSFDAYAEGAKGKHGTTEVDDAILAEIERWRDLLARNIALRNPQLSQRELNYAVQMTIDRILFLRICEDRGIEPYGQLQALLNGSETYPRLCQLFYKADQRYNSGLFHFRQEKGQTGAPDPFTLTLSLDDKPIKDILGNLYYPDSPYEFSVLPADILGQVYERFLGKVIRLTASHHAVVEDKPEVKKAGGVFYTPTFIVEYIVKNTLGKLLEGKKPGAGSTSLRVLDMACGSGSFLLGAYQFLLDWYLAGYTTAPEKWAKGKAPKLYRTTLPSPANGRGTAGEGWKLTTSERKRILLDHIYGVDIDTQAVEVTKLSLLLKVLEGESEQTLAHQLTFWQERALPDLSRNIKCGNSLIGPDFYTSRPDGSAQTRQASLPGFDQEEQYRINAFDWQKEFPEVFTPSPSLSHPKNTDRGGKHPQTLPSLGNRLWGEAEGSGGFDVVIGNPPYGAWFQETEKVYFMKQYASFGGTKDVYTCFIEKGLQNLNKNGLLSFILPSAWVGGPQYFKLRKLLLPYAIDRLVLLPFDIFADAYVDTLIIGMCNHEVGEDHVVLTHTFPKREKLTRIELDDGQCKQVKQKEWQNTDNNKFIFDPDTIGLIWHLRSVCTRTIGDVAVMKRGVLFDKSLLFGSRISKKYYRYFEGDVYRYVINVIAEQWVEFGEKMKERPKEFFWFEGRRILLRRLVNRQQRLMATITDETFITNKNLYSIRVELIDPQVFLAILNSKLLSFLYIKQVTQAVKDDFPQVTIKDILSLPFPSDTQISNVQQYDRMVALVERILALHRQLAAAKIPNEKTRLQRQIDATDAEIDRLVYELYDLTEEEIRVVEGK